MMRTRKALIIVDVQKDFCPGGALAVSDGDTIVPILNKYIDVFARNGWPILASRDWHPQETKHFKLFGGLWPEHCVQETKGACFHPDLKLPSNTIIVSKGASPDQDGYSAFEAKDDCGRDLMMLLKEKKIGELFVGGLATDYCVKATVLEGLKNFKVHVLVDAIKGVNLSPEDSIMAIDEMVASGAGETTFDRFLEKGFLDDQAGT